MVKLGGYLVKWRFGHGVVLGQTLERFPGKIQAGEVRILVLEQLHHPAALFVVLEATVVAHQVVERLFAGVAEWGVTKVVGKRNRLGKILVESQRAGDIPGDGGHLHCVCEPRAQVVAAAAQENLCFAVESSKGPGVDDPIAVALVLCPPFRRRLVDFSAF